MGMADSMTEASAPASAARIREGWIATWQVLVLAALSIVMFHHEMYTIMRFAWRDIDASQMLAAPVLIFLLWRARRHVLLDHLGRGSIAGVVLIVIALGIFTFSKWPFNYGYPRWLAIVPALAGGVLAVGGWRLFWTALPMLLVFLLAIPIGSRYYAFLIIRPETLTISAAAEVFNALPGVLVQLDGPDFTFFRGDIEGTIALGEPHRGA